MHWLRSHPFALLFAGAGIVVLAIVIAFSGRIVPPSSSSGTVVAIPGGGALQDPGISEPYTFPRSVQNTSIETPSAAGEAQGATLPPLNPIPSNASPPQQAIAPSDGDSSAPTPVFFGSTDASFSGPDTSLSDTLLSQAYAFVPSSYSLPLSVPTVRTPEQQQLYNYGNQAGLAVITFSNAHADMADVLTVWVEDRDNGATEASAQEIATDMIALGDTLLGLSSIPASAASANQALGLAYQDAGEKLREVIDDGGQGDSVLADSMQEYNASAEQFTRNYLALVDLFTQSGVTFAPTDMGSAFSPQGTSVGL